VLALESTELLVEASEQDDIGDLGGNDDAVEADDSVGDGGSVEADTAVGDDK
jgi:hypothetical protein